jgi:transposase-like protein
LRKRGVAERFCLIEELTEQHSVSWLCRQLGVARSGFYAWWQRQVAPGKRAAETAAITAAFTAEIKAVFQEHRGFYGSPRGRAGFWLANTEPG